MRNIARLILDTKKLREPLGWKKPRKIFVNSMSDLFHENITDDVIDQVFSIMALCPQHTFMVLTKRAKRMCEYTTNAELPHRLVDRMYQVDADQTHRQIKTLFEFGYDENGKIDTIELQWPLKNVQLGVSVEHQNAANERIPLLLECPAKTRFLSIEPLLGPVNLNQSWPFAPHPWPGINWIIAGGESGPGARPPHPDWIRNLRDHCRARSIPFFFKQWGEWAPADIDPSGDMFYHHRGRNVGRPKYKGIAVSRVDGQCSHDAERLNDPVTTAVMYRVGKKNAGNTLDGQQHLAFPEQT